VSVLGPLEPIDPAQPDAITIGRHGLVAEQGARRGLLLPQVATEWGWTAAQFLRQTCVKAGLPPDAWQHGARIFRFDAEVFGE
ncbi:MAG: AMMECR1 domain-containing protein, partial [Acidobacteriota bacterium]